MNDQNEKVLDEIFDEVRKSLNAVDFGSVNIQVRIHQGIITDYVYTPFVRVRTFMKPNIDKG